MAKRQVDSIRQMTPAASAQGMSGPNEQNNSPTVRAIRTFALSGLLRVRGCHKLAAMGRRKLLYYNDSRHTYMYSYDPPMTLEEARMPVDEVAGTEVDTFVYGSGAGPAVMHDTEVGEIWGSRTEKFGSAWAWRAHENVMSLIGRGIDPLNVLIDRAHEKGMAFFASLRMAHPMDPADTENPFNWKFRIDHPEMCLTGSGAHAFNWEYEEVRDERFAYIEEYVNRYEIEGIELEFSFCPSYFEDGEEEKKSGIMTDFLRRVRQEVDDASRRKQRRIELGVKIPPTESGNRGIGLDVPAWIKEGLVDFVVPTLYEDRQIDPDFPFEWLVELTDGTDCEVYPTLQRAVRGQDAADGRMEPGAIDLHAERENFYAAAASYWERGAAAIYMLFLEWPHGPAVREVLGEVHDPELLQPKEKRYLARRQSKEADRYGYKSSLKAFLGAGESHTVSMYIADELKDATVHLYLRLMWSTGDDDMTVSVNGTTISLEDAVRRDLDGYYGIGLEVLLAKSTVRQGKNDITISLDARPVRLGAPIVWEKAERRGAHATPQASSSIP